MKTPQWLLGWIARWRTSERTMPGPPRSGPTEIDIDLSGSVDAPPPGETTDYDVHSLGEPIDPVRSSATCRR